MKKLKKFVKGDDFDLFPISISVSFSELFTAKKQQKHITMAMMRRKNNRKKILGRYFDV